MILLDVNIMLAAHRADHPHHGLVRPWLEELLAGDERFAVPDIVWASFIRISTNRRVFETPTPVDAAFDLLRSVRAHPNHVPLEPGEAHLSVFEDLCRRYDAAGDLAADASLASIAIDSGSALASLDRDFARFDDLIWIRPGEA